MPISFIKLPSFERLNELLVYNPENGDLKWKVNRSNVKAGSIAGCIRTMKNGRQDWMVMVDSKLYTSTRIIWMLYHHEDPGLMSIDHVDRDTLNNRISNLRLADIHDQCMNTKRTSPSTATRYVGLAMHSYKNNKAHPRWEGKIQIAGHRYSFGSAAVNSINDDPPDWLIARSARLYTMRDDPDITDDTLIDEINALKRMPPVAPAAK